jgi:hypothetical protein
MNHQADFLGLGDDRALHEALRDRYNALASTGQITHSVDTLPHTEDEDLVYMNVVRRFDVTKNRAFVILMNWRKRGECQAPSSYQRPESA